MSTKPFKNEMTMADRGQIFILYDAGKHVDEIAEITNYNPQRLRWVIEACLGDSVWNESKQVYWEVENYGIDDKGHRDRHMYIGWAMEEKFNRRKKRSGTAEPWLASERNDTRITFSGIGGTRDEVAAHQGVTRQVSRTVRKSDSIKHESTNRGVPSRTEHRRQDAGSIIDGMRQSKDYKGE